MQKGKGVGSGRRGDSQGKRGGVFVSRTSPPSRGGGWGWRGDPSGVGNDNRKVRIPSVVSAPVIVVDRDARGPIIVKVKVRPADGNASTGVEEKSGVRKRGPSRQRRHGNRNDDRRRLGREVPEVREHRVSDKIDPRGTSNRGRMLGGGDAFDDLSDNVIKGADIVFGEGNLDMIGSRKWAFRDLAHMSRRDNVNARVGLKSDQLPPE